MKDSVALTLIAAIESAIRSIQIDKQDGWDQEVDELTEFIQYAMDCVDGLRKCPGCGEITRIGRHEDECGACYDSRRTLPDGSERASRG